MKHFVSLICILVTLLSGRCGNALMPENVLVIANKEVRESLELANYYRKIRGIPSENVLAVPLTVSDDITRQDYNVFQDKIASAIVSYNMQKRPEKRITALVLMYGVPLRVLPGRMDWMEEAQADLLRQKMEELKGKEEGHNQLKKLRNQLLSVLHHSEIASVDSELALVQYPKYRLQNWVENPVWLEESAAEKEDANNAVLRNSEVFIVGRLDGPSPQTVYRIIDDTIFAEKHGLRGKGYFDARWPREQDTRSSSPYARYDYSLYRAADIVRDKIETVVDSNESLFGENGCPDTALYCGWYSLGKYVDSFTWAKGSIGFHIASSECVSLHQPENTQWCASMLRKGAVAVIGPVAEPYLQAFPLPEKFFRELVINGKSLGESYMQTLPYLSWRMVLVGDPLYVPFPRQNK